MKHSEALSVRVPSALRERVSQLSADPASAGLRGSFSLSEGIRLCLLIGLNALGEAPVCPATERLINLSIEELRRF